MRDQQPYMELLAQARFEREQRQAWEARVVRAARKNPDVAMDMLAERFNTTYAAISKVLGKRGIHQEPAAEKIRPWARVRRHA